MEEKDAYEMIQQMILSLSKDQACDYFQRTLKPNNTNLIKPNFRAAQEQQKERYISQSTI